MSRENTKRVRNNEAVYKNVKLLSATDAWIKKNGKYALNTDKYNFIGKIEKENPYIIQKAFINEKDNNSKTAYIDDFSAFPKITKKSIIDYLYNGVKNKKQKVYLVQGEIKSNKNKTKKGR